MAGKLRFLGLTAFVVVGLWSSSALSQDVPGPDEGVPLPPGAEVPGSGAADSCGMTEFLQSIKNVESSGGNYGITSNAGFLGAYQIGEEKLIDLEYAHRVGNLKDNVISWTGKDGINSNADFLASREIQDRIMIGVKGIDWDQLNSQAKAAIGTTLPDGTVIDASALLGGAQFGSGKVNAYFANGRRCIPGKGTSTNDGNGKCVAEFMANSAGYDVSAITGQASTGGAGQNGSCANRGEPWGGDTTSRTCPPTVQMLQGIRCDLYPASLRGYCQRYKPFQMGLDRCKTAESFAENVPPSGPHLEACKQQTFQSGTGSWSYVLACAKTQSSPGPVGESNKTLANGDDPACYERLKALGVDFKPGGSFRSGPGASCVVPQHVTYMGGSIPFSSSLSANCAVVEQFEHFAREIKALGVTKIDHIGSISCRNMQGGGSSRSPSLHSSGNAVDVSAFYINGKKYATGDYWSDPSVRPMIDAITAISCKHFNGTLGLNYYRTKGYRHLHFQATKPTRCDPPQK